MVSFVTPSVLTSRDQPHLLVNLVLLCHLQRRIQDPAEHLR